MGAARIAGGITALVLTALLLWLAFATFGRESVVLPTVQVRGEEPMPIGREQQGRAASRALAARTELMRFRTETGHSAFPEEALEGTKLELHPGVMDGRSLVQSWEKNKPIGQDQLKPSGDVFGTSSLPYANADMLQQPGGRDWRRAHNDQIRFGGGWVLFGIAFALALFLFWRGRIKVTEGFSGHLIERFNTLERANHWMTASAFVLMALTGLILLYGKPLLIPLMGEAAFGNLAFGSAWLHMASAVPFVIGIVVMIIVWLKDNLPTRLDWEWLKRGGGFLRDDGHNPPARKFNAGQKLVFWGVTVGGLATLASGAILMLPFYWFGYDGMQWAQITHAAVALLLIALIIGHIYIGTIGMEGAIDAMWDGKVDRNWAKEHHSIWYDRIIGRQEDEHGHHALRGKPEAAE